MLDNYKKIKTYVGFRCKAGELALVRVIAKVGNLEKKVVSKLGRHKKQAVLEQRQAYSRRQRVKVLELQLDYLVALQRHGQAKHVAILRLQQDAMRWNMMKGITQSKRT